MTPPHEPEVKYHTSNRKQSGGAISPLTKYNTTHPPPDGDRESRTDENTLEGSGGRSFEGTEVK